MPGTESLFAERIPCSANPIRYRAELCVGCGRCAAVCPSDVLVPVEKGKPPVVMYPGECIYCGACVMECPRKGAIRLEHPLMNQSKFVPVIPANSEYSGGQLCCEKTVK